MSNPDQPVLTLEGCNRMCGGSSFKWYKDRGPRLNTWLIPVILLLSNVEVSPLDKRRYLMIVHLVGDSTDSLWSLLTKLEAWSRCHSLARQQYPKDRRRARNLGTVLGAIEELVGTHTNPLMVYEAITTKFALSKYQRISGDAILELLVARTAQELSDSRTDERLRTLLATVLYVYQVLSAFLAILGGGNSSPPGGRIGTAMFLTWIVPSILLSNAMGTFTSSRTCFTVLERFFQDATGESDLWEQLQSLNGSNDSTHSTLKRLAAIDTFYDAQSFSGGIYTYRPQKRLKFSTGSNDRHPIRLLLLALSPIIVASFIGSVIIWHTPPL
ncbi:hypothetical protein BCR34DRAFT_475538 [Clohesyomyces aquaticus]|uniref:Uncharacterized protein n=1 Tax=Clohesyomyces aquaticus TaxID=1231657 RepID=A0A1Y2A363_9PLEO|nr:hypothetical protein BCR34DRAFT_475538 [Clohesyomyces aquaticus]